MSNEGREFSWDDQIENDGADFVTLSEGDYDFEIIDFERARHNGSEKLPACNKAIVHIKITAPEGVTVIKHNLFLHSITEGMLCAFFTGIGQRKKSEKVTMNWGAVIGSGGRAKVGVRKWKKDDGTEVVFNEIKKFYEPTDGPQDSKVGFQAGKF